MSCIYILKNKTNNMQYVGQTIKNFEKRMGSHLREAKRARKNCSKIDRAINKYGIENFEKYVYECPEEDLDYLETEMIKILDSINNGYNLDSGGHKNKHHSEESLQIMREKKKGSNHPMFGRKQSDETKQKISIAKKGKYSGSLSSMYGKRHSDKAKKKMSIGHKSSSSWPKGKSFSEEHKANLSKSRIGIVYSEETKKKMGDAKRGIPLSEDHKQKISLSMKAKKTKNNFFYVGGHLLKVSPVRKITS
jgi:group I intron endonuclease